MPHSGTIGDRTQGNFKISQPTQTHVFIHTQRVLIIAIIRLTCGFIAGKHRNSETIYLKVLGKITTWREYPPVIQMRKGVFQPSKLKGCVSLALQSQQCCGMLLRGRQMIPVEIHRRKEDFFLGQWIVTLKWNMSVCMVGNVNWSVISMAGTV